MSHLQRIVLCFLGNQSTCLRFHETIQLLMTLSATLPSALAIASFRRRDVAQDPEGDLPLPLQPQRRCAYQ